jgi:hypothetical protein
MNEKGHITTIASRTSRALQTEVLLNPFCCVAVAYLYANVAIIILAAAGMLVHIFWLCKVDAEVSLAM